MKIAKVALVGTTLLLLAAVIANVIAFVFGDQNVWNLIAIIVGLAVSVSSVGIYRKWLV